MRLIGTLINENEALRIISYLKEKGIETHRDQIGDGKGQFLHQIWVMEEDQIADATRYFQQFIQTPSDPEFDAPARISLREVSDDDEPLQDEEEKREPLRRTTTPLTAFLLFLCSLIFFLNYVEELPMREENLSSLFLFTPVQALLLYDLPEQVEKIESFVEKHSVTPDQKIENLAPEVTAELEQLEKTPYFRGVFDWLLLKLKGEDTSLVEGPMFLKIRQGEIWRLFTPAILHTQFLHILFNMIWLWVLGKPIEQRIGIRKTFVLTLATGIGSNTLQYLAGGPFFLGYSGVVMGLAGFIWVREKKFPWEGYPINRSVFLFLILFVTAIFCLSFFAFFLELWTGAKVAPGIANSAHIVGGGIGAWLGRYSWFSWRPKTPTSEK